MAVFAALVANSVGFGAAMAATSVGSFFTSTILGRLLGSVALSLLQSALAPKPPTPGITTEYTQNGGVNPCAFILGKYATAGDNICPPMTHGKVGKTPNAYLTYVIELGDVAGQTLSRVLIDGAYEAFTGAVHADYGTAAVGRLAGYAWAKYYDGTQTVADPMLLAKYGSYPERPWLADMVGTGMCYAIMTFRYNRELYQSLPQCRFEMGGIKLYDPRADTSVGGSGAQRWSNPATWTQTENPVVMVYNIQRGITLPGLGVWGGDASAEDQPLASAFAAMNKCDVATALAAGGTEPAYRAGYEVTIDKEPASVIEELLKACGGQVAEIGGQWKYRVGGVDLPVYFMTDADVIISKPQDYDPFPTADRRMNGIDAQYPDPADGWEPKAAPSRFNATWEAEDGGKRRVPAPITGDLMLFGRDGSWIETGVTLPSGAFDLGPTGTVLTQGVLRALGDLVGVVIIGRTTTATERALALRYFVARGAAGCLVAGAELGSNGGFATDTGWTKGAGWTIAAGVATHAPGAGSDIEQAGLLVAGQLYLLTVTAVAVRTTSILYVHDGGAYLEVGGTPSLTARIYQAVFRATASRALSIRVGSLGDVDIDNLSLKPLTPGA